MAKEADKSPESPDKGEKEQNLEEKAENLENSSTDHDGEEKAQEEKKKPRRRCAVCEETKNAQFCSGCQLVAYCSVDHQRVDWKNHKPNCLASRKFPINLIPYDDENENRGQLKNNCGFTTKYAVATQDIKQGDVVVEEIPLFYHMSYVPKKTEIQGKKKFTFCLSCGVTVRFGKLDKKKDDKDTKKTEQPGTSTEQSEGKKSLLQNFKSMLGMGGKSEDTESEKVEESTEEKVEEPTPSTSEIEEAEKIPDPVDTAPSSGSGEVLELDEDRQCPTCGWPVCSKTCAQESMHTDYECKIFTKNKIRFNGEKYNSSKGLQIFDEYWRMITTARAIGLAKNKPKIWKELLEILPENQVQEESDDYIDMLYLGLSHFSSLDTEEEQNLLKDLPPKLGQISREAGFNLEPRVHTDKNSFNNSFDIVYQKASHFPHSCAPNCFIARGDYPDRRIRIRASFDLKKGDRLYLNRLDDSLYLKGTAIRQHLYSKKFKRPCTCALCRDPTEFGTYQSALTCQPCYQKIIVEQEGKDPLEVGYFVPNFLAPEESSFEIPVPATTTNEVENDQENLEDQNTAFEFWKCSKCHRIVPEEGEVDNVEEEEEEEEEKVEEEEKKEEEEEKKEDEEEKIEEEEKKEEEEEKKEDEEEKIEEAKTEEKKEEGNNDKKKKKIVKLSRQALKNRVSALFEGLEKVQKDGLPTFIAEELAKVQGEQVTFLHPNHWVLQLAALLFRKSRFGPSGPNFEEFLNNRRITDYILNILERTLPGLSAPKAYFMHLSVIEVVGQSLTPLSSLKEEGPEIFQKYLNVTLAHLDELLIYYNQQLATDDKKEKISSVLHFTEIAKAMLKNSKNPEKKSKSKIHSSDSEGEDFMGKDSDDD